MTITALSQRPQLHAGPTFGEILIRAIRRYAAEPAIRCGDKTLTYSQMGEEISRLVQALRAAGVRRGTGVAVLVSNRVEAITVRMAVHLLGARFTALTPVGSTADHIFIIQDSEAEVAIVESRFAATAAAIRAAEPGPKLLSLGAIDDTPNLLDAADRFAPEPLRCEADPLGIAALTYTGGTTGRPKGIIQSHRVLMMNLLMCLAEWDWPRRPSILLMTPLSHAAGLLTMPVFVKGGTVHVHDGFDAPAFFDLVRAEGISVTFLVPTMLHAIVRQENLRAEDLSTMELVIYGAAPIRPALLEEAIGILGPVFLQLYAQSEAPMTVTTLNIDDHELDRPERLLSCGFPMVGVQVRLLDEEAREVPPGDVGEVCVRGPLVMDGYWNRPEETAAAFKDDWLWTGDLARADAEGYLYLVDRKKELIISGGFNIYPKEVEDALISHLAVEQAAVFGVPDEKWGEAIKAAVVLCAGASLSERELIEHVRTAKGPISAPKSIDFIAQMPQTALGKPDKQSLRAAYWSASMRNIG